MQRPLTRNPVTAPPSFYETYSIRTPKSSVVPATCEEVSCPYMARGFKVSVDESKTVGQQNAAALRKDPQRTPKESRDEFGMTIFEYAPGTRCMSKHTKRLDDSNIFLVRGGDHRGNPKGTQTRTHTKPEFWVEEFAETQDKIIKAIEKRD